MRANPRERPVHRRRVIVTAILFAILGGVLPMAAMYYVSWTRAVHKEQKQLKIIAERVLVRARMSFQQATEVLKTLDQLNVRPCSPVHIEQMRTLTINTRAVEEIGYFEDGLLKCTSWGLTEQTIKQLPGDFVTKDAIHVKLRMSPQVTGGKPMMALHYKQYNVLMDPARLVDVITDENVQFGVGTGNGELIAASNGTNATELAWFLAKSEISVSDRYIVGQAGDAAWTAAALMPRADIFASLRREQILLLPIGAIIAAALIAIVVWLSRRRLSPLGELEIAIQKREFVVHYQPIIELGTSVCVGAEALVRWKRPDGSMVRPDLFIPLAEDTGLIAAVTDQVIENVVKDLKSVLVSDRTLHVAINICAEDIETGRVVPVMHKAIEGTGIDASQIWLEATERGLIDQASSHATLSHARDLGFTIAIDDFGTGYSSLSYLQSMPVDILKIDKSFIDTIGTDSAKSSVTPYIIDMAKALNLKIVAEGVETKEQQNYLCEHGVQYGQGWLFAKALPALEFVAFCQRHRRPEHDRSHIQLVA